MKWVGGALALVLSSTSSLAFAEVGQPQLTLNQPDTSETAVLAAYPALAKRDAEGLTVFHKGDPIAHHNNLKCGDADSACQYWFFAGPIVLKSKTTGRLETYAQIYVRYYEGDGAIIPTESGPLFHLWAPGVASPDGKTIATGEDVVNDENDSYALTIFDWTGKAKPSAFKPSCKPLKWLGADRFTARCALTMDNLSHVHQMSEAIASRNTRGQWSLRQTRILDAATLSPLPDAQQTLQTFYPADLQ